MLKRARIFLFDFWHYLLFGIFVLIVILSVGYFNQSVYEQRQQRLQDVYTDQVRLADEIVPPAGPDRLVMGFLLPPVDIHIPLPADWSIRENWGEAVNVKQLRIPSVPLQTSPVERGPAVTP